VRIWSKAFSIDPVKLPSGKIVTLINIPFYLVSEIENILTYIVC